MKKILVYLIVFCIPEAAGAWGFYTHKLINRHAVFLLPPEMMILYKANLEYLSDHAVDPDKRRYAVEVEGARHYIDLDRYDKTLFLGLNMGMREACRLFTEDSVQSRGIVPWWIQTMLSRLTNAFRTGNAEQILKYSAELGHYIGDAHVPLHATSNHNGQLTQQHGIHGFWESRIPELLAEKEWDFWIGSASYISKPLRHAWKTVLESNALADTVLALERELNSRYPSAAKYAFENRSGVLVRQYSEHYTLTYNRMLNGMVEKRFRQSVSAVASFWYTAWVNAGQPDLRKIATLPSSGEPSTEEFNLVNRKWKEGKVHGKACE